MNNIDNILKKIYNKAIEPDIYCETGKVVTGFTL